MSNVALTRLSTPDLRELLDKSKSRLERVKIQQELARRNNLSIRSKDLHNKDLHNKDLHNKGSAGETLGQVYSTIWDQTLDSGQESQKDTVTLSVEAINRRFPDDQKLRSYQEAGIEFTLRSWRKFNGVMLAHFAGAGKTRQAACVQKLANTRRTLYLTKKGGGLVKKTADELNSSYRLMHSSDETPHMAFPIQSELNVAKSAVRSQFDIVYNLPSNVTVVTNYESLNTFPWLFDYNFDLLIVDEVHKLKGGADYYPTKIWKNTKDFVYINSNEGVIPDNILFPVHSDGTRIKKPAPLPTNVDKYLFLTGTPTSNHPKEYFAYLNIFNPRLFNDKKVIFDTFEAIRDGHIPLGEAEVIKMLTPMMHRLTKDDVADQLPPVIINEYTVNLSEDSGDVQSQSHAYETAREELIMKLSDEPGDVVAIENAITKLTRLRQINVYGTGIDMTKNRKIPRLGVTESGDIDYAYNEEGEVIYDTIIDTKSIRWKNNGKLMAIIEKIEELQFENERCVVFSAQFNDPLYYLKAHFDSLGLTRAEIIDGKTKNAADIVDQWQAGEIDVLLLNAKVAAEGLNLQRSPKWPGGASHALFIDKWWSPSIQQQAISRLHRLDTIGPVFVHFFTALRFNGHPTVDGLLNEILEEKQWWVDNIDNNERFRVIDKKKLMDLF